MDYCTVKITGTNNTDLTGTEHPSEINEIYRSKIIFATGAASPRYIFASPAGPENVKVHQLDANTDGGDLEDGANITNTLGGTEANYLQLDLN